MAQDKNKHHNSHGGNSQEPDWAVLLDQLEASHRTGKPLTEIQLQQLEELRTLIAETSDALTLYAKLDVDRGWEELRALAEQRQLVPADPISRTADTSVKQLRVWPRIVAAAAIVVVFSIGGYYYYQQQQEVDAQTLAESDVLPGGNRATLTLADGSKIDLSGDQSGIIVGDNGIKYNDGSSIDSSSKRVILRNDGPLSAKQVENLSLSTPKGGQYQITLPDGTKVWLNAASTLRYPSRFDGTSRTVEITGEAYFQAARHKSKPFIVKSDKQEIQVLGTEFNVSNYEGETMATTLLEGSVRLHFIEGNHQSVILQPGQQAILKHDRPTILQVNTDDYVAWARGLFVFNDLPLTEILKRLERWYDIEVVYPKNFKDERFFAEIPRDRKLSEVLHNLAHSGNFKFEQKGRRVIVEQ